MEDRNEVYLRARSNWSRQPSNVIPVLDLGAYLAQERGAEQPLTKQLRKAQQNIGFFFLKNHGVSDRLVERTFAAVEDFFALPLDNKLALLADQGFTGYIPLSGSLLKNSYVGKNTKPDLTETLNFIRDFPSDNPHVIAGRKMMGPNKWPSELPWLKPV